jgi:hypothetical protein
MTDATAVVEFKGDLMQEPIRSREWKLEILWHVNGRLRV